MVRAGGNYALRAKLRPARGIYLFFKKNRVGWRQRLKHTTT
jgi:hypothetical protein